MRAELTHWPRRVNGRLSLTLAYAAESGATLPFGADGMAVSMADDGVISERIRMWRGACPGRNGLLISVEEHPDRTVVTLTLDDPDAARRYVGSAEHDDDALLFGVLGKMVVEAMHREMAL